MQTVVREKDSNLAHFLILIETNFNKYFLIFYVIKKKLNPNRKAMLRPLYPMKMFIR